MAGALKYWDSSTSSWKYVPRGPKGDKGDPGTMVGPASATDNALVRFDGTTGGLVQTSLAILDDTGHFTGLKGVAATGATTEANVLDISGDTYPVGRITRTGTATSGSKTAFTLRATSTGQMVDGFGPEFEFVARDADGTDNSIGLIRAVRNGADNTGRIDVTVAAAGTPTINLSIMSNDAQVATAGTATQSVVTNGATQTLTNKRVTPRIQDQSAATGAIAPTSDTVDEVVFRGMTGTVTVSAPTGTPTQGQKLMLRFKDNGTARTITWNAIYRIVGTALPTTTVVNKTTYVGCVYNSTDTKWDVIAVAQEA